MLRHISKTGETGGMRIETHSASHPKIEVSHHQEMKLSGLLRFPDFFLPKADWDFLLHALFYIQKFISNSAMPDWPI